MAISGPSPAANSPLLVRPGRRVALPGGTATSVLEAGPPGPVGKDRPALLLLHGWMATAALNWDASLEAISADFKVVAPDLRGHGRYGHSSPPFSVEGCADDQAELVDVLGLGPVVVVGYSMGGAVAQVMARRHPEVVRGLVLCATAASFAERTWLRPLVKLVGKVAGSTARRWQPAAQRAMRRRMDRRDAAGEAGGGLHPVWALEERYSSSVAAFIEAGAMLNAFDSKAWLHELKAPTAVVVTTSDQRVPPWRQDTLVALVPGARRYTVDGGHDAIVSQQDRFMPVLRRACLDVSAAGTMSWGPF
jgi:3-oxoadipate enol-lactonase